MLGRQKDHEYSVDHGAGPGGGVFYIRTNANGQRNFCLVAAPADDPGPERWHELIAHRDDVMLEDVDVFAAHYVVHERTDGLIRLLFEKGLGLRHLVERKQSLEDAFLATVEHAEPGVDQRGGKATAVGGSDR